MNELTENQIDTIVKIAEEGLTPELKKLRDIQNGIIPAELLAEEESLPTNQYAKIDAVTGEIVGFGEFDTETDLEKELADVDTSEIEAAMEKEENVEAAIKSTYGAEDVDIETLHEIMDLMKKRKAGERIYYNDLPIDFQRRIMQTISSESNGAYIGNKEIRNQMAEAVIDNIIAELLQGEMNKTIVDLQNSVNTYMTKELGEMVNTSRAQQHKIMAEQLPVLASKAKQDDPEKADMLLKIHDAYMQAYTLDDMFDSYCHGKPKIKKIDIEKIQKLYYTFNHKYDTSKWQIRDVAMLAPILDRNIDKSIDMDDILTFIAIFIKYTDMKKMTPENIWDHTFMYYTVFNIASLDVYTKVEGLEDKDVEFYEGFLKNLDKFFDEIKRRKDNKNN